MYFERDRSRVHRKKNFLLRWSSLLGKIRHHKLRGIGDALVLFFYVPSLKLTAKAPENIFKRKFHPSQPLIFRTAKLLFASGRGPHVGRVLGILSGTPGEGHFSGIYFALGSACPTRKSQQPFAAVVQNDKLFREFDETFNLKSLVEQPMVEHHESPCICWFEVWIILFSAFFFAMQKRGYVQQNWIITNKKLQCCIDLPFMELPYPLPKYNFTSATEIRSQWVVPSKVSFHRNVFRWHCEIWGYKNSHVNTLLRWPKRGWNRVSLFAGRFFVG